MATKKKLEVKAKPKARLTRAKPSKKKVVVAKKKKAAPSKKKTAASTKKVPRFEEASTQQLAFAEIIGDIEERMALDRLDETR